MIKQMKLQKNFFDSHKNRYQSNLESMEGSVFVFDGGKLEAKSEG